MNDELSKIPVFGEADHDLLQPFNVEEDVQKPHLQLPGSEVGRDTDNGPGAGCKTSGHLRIGENQTIFKKTMINRSGQEYLQK